MDKELLNILLGGDVKVNELKTKSSVDYETILDKLNEIDNKLQLLLKSKTSKPLCEQILEKTFVILSDENLDPKLNPSLFILDLEGGRVLVTFKDTMDLLQTYFQVYKKDIENKIPRRLFPLFTFLKRNGLIYFDHETQTYKLV